MSQRLRSLLEYKVHDYEHTYLLDHNFNNRKLGPIVSRNVQTKVQDLQKANQRHEKVDLQLQRFYYFEPVSCFLNLNTNMLDHRIE